MSSVRKYYIKY